MECGETIEIGGPPGDVRALSRAVERWPLLFPDHHRARVMGRYGERTVIQFQLRLGPLPVGWTAEQTPVPGEDRFIYEHVRGLAPGLRTEWRIMAQGGGTLVTVTHAWHPAWRVVGPVVAWLVCHLVMRPLTRRTLAALRQSVESGQAAALRRLDDAYK